MKVVVTGKGGVGKTTVAGGLARHLARSGQRVVALDCDPSPNLGLSLGLVPEEVENFPPILNGLVSAGGTYHGDKPDPELLLDRFGVDVAGGVRLVAVARIDDVPGTCMCCGSHVTTRELFADLSGEDRVVVADLEAGLNDLRWARPGPGDVVVVVADPSAKSVEIARRARRIAAELGVRRIIGVANRCSGPDDGARLAEALGTAVTAISYDPEVAAVDEAGRSPVDLDGSSPAMVAIAGLATMVLEPVCGTPMSTPTDRFAYTVPEAAGATGGGGPGGGGQPGPPGASNQTGPGGGPPGGGGPPTGSGGAHGGAPTGAHVPVAVPAPFQFQGSGGATTAVGAPEQEGPRGLPPIMRWCAPRRVGPCPQAWG